MSSQLDPWKPDRGSERKWVLITNNDDLGKLFLLNLYKVDHWSTQLIELCPHTRDIWG